MTPGARVAAAAEILDRIAQGDPAERSLTSWARRARYAGSKDRRAVRDHVFNVLRRWWSTAWVGGGDTGRHRMLGALILDGDAPETFFTGEGHAPSSLTPDETAAIRELSSASDPVRADLPQWVFEMLTSERGVDEARAIGAELRQRASIHLRVNLARTTPDDAIALLAAEGIVATRHPEIGTALCVTAGETRVASSKAYLEGQVELQDAASQAVTLRLEPLRGTRVLDYCAGGGGKSLALAAQGAQVIAHDIDSRRMRDLPTRAKRAGVWHAIETTTRPEGRFELVLADAPCSGSGAWRRQPEAKLRLTPDRLASLNAMQDDVLAAAAAYVEDNGRLAYATCSILRAENEVRIDRFLDENPGWTRSDTKNWSPAEGTDGFHLSVLTRV